MWQPNTVNSNYKHFKENEVIEMLFQLADDPKMSNYEMTRDKHEVVDINSNRKEKSSDGSFYEMEEREGEIINVIIASGTEQRIDAVVGKGIFKLCVDGIGHCFKARVIAMADKFPGFA